MRRTALALAALVACGTRVQTLDTSAIELGGCARVLAGPVCALGPDRELTLWLPSDGVGARLETGGRELLALRAAVGGGTRLTVVVPPGASELVLAVATGPRRGRHLLPLTVPPVFERVSAAEALRKAGEGTRAERELTASLAKMAPPERAEAIGLLGRIALAEGRDADAIAALGRSHALHLEMGCLSCALRDGTALAYALTYDARELGRAREVLDRLERETAADSTSRVYVPYFLGLLEREGGDLRSSMRALERAEQAAERLGMETMHRMAVQMMAVGAQALGDHDSAARLLGEVRVGLPASADPCERAALSNNLGWIALLAADARRGDGPAPSAEADLTSALELYESQCARPAEAANTLTNLALAAIMRGDAETSQRRLSAAAARVASPEPRLRLWQLDIAARIALAAGRAARAVALFEELDHLAVAVAAVEASWRAAQGKAQALRRLGRSREALAAYELAEERLDEAAKRVSLGDGRDAFYGFYARGTSSYVEALLEDGRPEEAAWAARRGRSRMLQALARVGRLETLSGGDRARWEAALAVYRREREALEQEATGEWQLAADDRERLRARQGARHARLRAALDEAFDVLGDQHDPRWPARTRPQEGELVLTFHPSGRGWAGIAVDGAGARSARFTADDLDAPGRLLAAFDGEVARAKRIRVIAVGAVEAVDFHAVEWRGRPLVAHAAVAYGQDVAPVERTRGAAGAPFATVLVDGGGRLPGARGEVDDVRGALVARGWRVRTLGGGKVTARDVIRAAAESTLLHYAGHGESPGDPWQSALVLGGGARLVVGDVLTLPRAPRVVVLAACDVARAGGASVSGVALAQAFLTAGAGAVIAAPRAVDDVEGRELARALYRHLDGLEGWEVAEALRAAQLERAEHAGATQWAALRVLLP